MRGPSQMITRAVEEQHGGAEAFNYTLRLQLLLEPLSYAVDLRRLAQRATGTRWRWQEAESWLGQGPAGQRVLCVAAGAGEGKSTVAAAICMGMPREGLGAGVGANVGRAGEVVVADRSVIAAHHFVKYNDQRRLEPLRIIKSLACQLATTLPVVREALLQLDAAVVARLADVGQAFQMLLAKPLEAWDKKAERDEQIVLLLDALDEADPPRQRLQQQQRVHPGAQSAELAGSQALRLSAASSLMVGPRPPPDCPIIAGNPALQLVSEWLHKLPRRVRFMLTTRPEAARGQAQADQVEDLLAVLLAAQEPLPLTLLQQVGLGDQALLALLPGWPALFFVEQHRAHTFHKSLADYLLTRCVHGGTIGASSARPTGARLAPGPGLTLDLQRGHFIIGARLTQTRRPALTAYALRHLVPHLVAATQEPEGGDGGGGAASITVAGWAAAAAFRSAASRGAAMAMLDEVLLDMDYMQAAIDAGYGHAIVGALGAMRVHSDVSAEALRYLRARLHEVGPKDRLVESILKHTPRGSLLYGAAVRSSGCRWLNQVVIPAAPAATEGGHSAEWPISEAVFQARNSMLLSIALSPDSKQLAIGTAGNKIFVYDIVAVRQLLVLKPQLATPPPLRRDRKVGAARRHSDSSRDGSEDDGGACSGGGYGDSYGPSRGGDSSPIRRDSEGDEDTVGAAVSGSDWNDPEFGDGQLGEVRGIAFSPDGSRMAAGGGMGIVQVFDVATGQVAMTLQGLGGFAQRGGVNCVRFSPCGIFLAAASDGDYVYIHNASTGRGVILLDDHQRSVDCLAFSSAPLDGAGGPELLATGGEDCVVNIYMVGNWRRVARLEPGRGALHGPDGHDAAVKSVAFNPAVAEEAASSDDGGAIRVWRLTRRPDRADKFLVTVLQRLAGPAHEAVSALAYAPDGRHLACGGDRGTVRLYDARTWLVAAEFREHERRIRELVYSRDGRHLVSGCEDSTAVLFNLEQVMASARSMMAVTAAAAGVSGGGAPRLRVKRRVTSLACQPCGRHVAMTVDVHVVATGADSHAVEVHDVQTGKLIAEPSVPRGMYGRCVVYSGDGKHLVLGCHHKLLLYDVAAGYSSPHDVSAFIGLRYPHDALAAGPSVALLAHCSNRRLVIDDCVQRCRVAELPNVHKELIRAVTISADGTLIATGGDDRTVRIHGLGPRGWRANLAVLSGYSDWLRGVAFSPDGALLAAGGDDDRVCIYRRADRSRGGTSSAGPQPPELLPQPHPEQPLHDWQLVSTVAADPGVCDMAFSREGSFLAVGCHGGRLLVLDATASAPQVMDTLHGHSAKITGVAFSSSGALVSGDVSGSVRVWSLPA
ncbi:hypothetical protein GPECTOR_6g552 [Gonium pectorale]|uniref:Nephrocystin 3-like N-terminal domain-containing protein n=1 Tax=Gonium pectorale TaxID=33097 RepID=A0A150GUU6_GONPE|nr:hypothetical protein GPECTOR_6g552 [Gonium pectorale]|eukprot:KXZ53635.1 hypothetical protein GPECTOR_6g552 [Gonium pectorale]